MGRVCRPGCRSTTASRQPMIFSVWRADGAGEPGEACVPVVDPSPGPCPRAQKEDVNVDEHPPGDGVGPEGPDAPGAGDPAAVLRRWGRHARASAPPFPSTEPIGASPAPDGDQA